MVEILPAILAKAADEYVRKLKTVEPFTEWVQIDIIDNIYARNHTIDAKVVGDVRTRCKLEIHLMVERIENWIDPFIKVKPHRIIVPIESAREPILLVRHLNHHQIPFGFSLDPHTPVESVQHLVDKVDEILLLAVNPGFSGQHFYHGVLDKIRKLRAMRPDLKIEIDGGIEPDTARKCAEVGANMLACGSFIFENDKMVGATYKDKVRNSIESLKENLEGIIPESAA